MLTSALFVTSFSAASFFLPRVFKKEIDTAQDAVLSFSFITALLRNQQEAREIDSLASKALEVRSSLTDFYWLAFLIIGFVSISLNIMNWQDVFCFSAALSFGLTQAKKAFFSQQKA